MKMPLKTLGLSFYSLAISATLVLNRLAAQPTYQSSPYIVSTHHLPVGQESAHRQALMVGQDKTGFIWVSTADNAYRFDGQQFEGLPPVTSPISQRRYNAGFNLILTDQAGNLWLGGSVIADERPLLIVQPEQRRAKTIEQAFGHSDPFRHDVIYEFARSPANSFRYVRTQSGTIWRHSGQGRFKKLFQHQALAKQAHINTIYETSRHTLLVSLPATQPVGTSELLELDSTGRVLRHQVLPLPLRPIGEGAGGTVFLHRLDDELDFRVGELLYTLSPGGQLTIRAASLAPGHPAFTQSINMIYDPKHDLFWLTGMQLLMAWHPQKGIVFELSQNEFLRQNVWWFKHVLIDRTGVVWVTTNNGVLLLTLEANRFQRYLHVTADQPGALRQGIRGMLQIGQQLWVNGPESQLVDLKTGKPQFILRRANAIQPKKWGFCPIVQDQNGAIWTGLTTIYRVEPTTLRMTPFGFTADNNCVALWPDHSGRLWVGSHHGLSILDTKTGQLRPFTGYGSFGELAQCLISGFFPDQQAGGVWVTASSGLYLLDTLRGIIARYSKGDNAPNRLPFDELTFVHPDPDEPWVYWLATRGGGLIRWNRQTGNWQQFTRKQGLSDNTIYAIYEDRYGRLWLPSNYGLMSFGRKTHRVQIFHTQDGIADEEFNLIGHYRAPDGRLFLGGQNGITAFYPDHMLPEKAVSVPMLLTQYHKLDLESGQMINSLAQFEREGQIHLNTSDRLFSLGFVLLDYRQVGKSRLWYRIQNWQGKWVMQEQPELRINGLPPGEYMVQVRAQALNGNWASPILSIPIMVDKPVYLRGWFLLLWVIAVVLMIGLVFRWRNKRLVADNLRLEAEVARRTAQIEADKAIIEQQAADLADSATLKSRFFANVSHEFRTPLTLLMGPLQYLNGRTTDVSVRQLLGAMERNARQLLTLVNDLLDFSRLDTHQLALTEQPGDLAQVIAQTAATFLPQAQHTGVELRLSGCDMPCPLWLDTPKLETVLRNVIANALRHTPMGGRIQLSLQRTKKEVQLVVSDTGSGIHPDDLPHIFERYFQTKQPDKPLRGGTGIGLALCQEYCQLWGGSITAHSEPGKGSHFTIIYPLRAVEGKHSFVWPPAEPAVTSVAAAVVWPTALSSANPSSPLKILVVDDHADMLLYIQTILAPYYGLHIAHNGRQALDLLAILRPEELPDLVISDLMMPDIDGLALAHALRSHPTWRSLPIMILTARTDLETRLAALQLGVADYLTKPFYEAELLARTQNLLRRADEQAIWQQAEESTSGNEALQQSLVYDVSEQEWLRAVQQVILENIGDELFNVQCLADKINISKRQLSRRTKLAVGLSPNQLIQEVRLQMAHDLLNRQNDIQIKSVAYQVGYQKTSYFIQLYRERFGVNPGKQVQLSNNLPVVRRND